MKKLVCLVFLFSLTLGAFAQDRYPLVKQDYDAFRVNPNAFPAWLQEHISNFEDVIIHSFSMEYSNFPNYTGRRYRIGNRSDMLEFDVHNKYKYPTNQENAVPLGFFWDPLQPNTALSPDHRGGLYKLVWVMSNPSYPDGYHPTHVQGLNAYLSRIGAPVYPFTNGLHQNNVPLSHYIPVPSGYAGTSRNLIIVNCEVNQRTGWAYIRIRNIGLWQSFEINQYVGGVERSMVIRP